MPWHTAIRLTVFKCAVSRIDLCPVTSSPFRNTRYRVYLYVCLFVCLDDVRVHNPVAVSRVPLVAVVDQ